MHLKVFCEEISAEKALENLLPKILHDDVECHINAFRGKSDLLKKLPDRLHALSKWLPDEWRIVILVDRDNDDCRELKSDLEQIAADADLGDRVLNRIAIEELEAWFFGDVQALRAVYPRVSNTLHQKASYRDPDAIKGGTWEALDRVLKNAGYPEGLTKTKCAQEVSKHMTVANNQSHSFRAFVEGLRNL